MGNSSFSENRHRDSNRLFLKFNPNKILPIKQTSRFFLSLVACLKNRSELDDAATQKACALLEWIESHYFVSLPANQILFELAPTPDGSCTGFVESLVLLLTSSNEAIILSTLSFLTHFARYLSGCEYISFMMSGFFEFLPNAFYFHEIHLTPHPNYFLMNIVGLFLVNMPKGRRIVLYGPHQLTGAAFNQIMTDHFLRPIQPFLTFIFQQRHRFEDTDASTDFAWLLGVLATHFPFVAPMTQLGLSSSFALTYTDSLIFFETDRITLMFINWILPAMKKWPKSDPAVWNRGRQILAQLKEEGISDEIELHVLRQPYISERRLIRGLATF
ncbi:hypothetical protein BLNAU_20699 [Blattamonas nauphoetae]|uniref:Uncharacterized protein n=1 Tax=Blattamonas nauphoetae TaxID=2049346 RepID=A0ABQ9X0A5_9EUKA|nr:hypothetical protein BLNAU_20699 [Blattamonas nauphoetae]